MKIRASRFRRALAPFILGAFALLALLAPLSVVEAQAPLRVMSFNIRYGTANDGIHRWPERRSAVVETIRDHAPHVLGLQEALRFQLDELHAALPGYRVIGVGREDGRDAGEFAAVLVDTSRLEVVESGTYWLSETPDVPGSVHWGNRLTRITTWVRAVDRARGDTIRAYNAHWDHESQPSRVRAAEQLLERIRAGAATDAILVLGDFNADESNPAFRRLVSGGSGLRDTFRSLHPSAVAGTFHSFRGDSSGGKIDAVLADRRWRVIEAGIDRRVWGQKWASDHFAVWAVVDRMR